MEVPMMDLEAQEGYIAEYEKACEADLDVRNFDKELEGYIAEYEKACEADLDVRNFDKELEARTRGVIQTLGNDGVFADSVKAASVALLESDKAIKKIISENSEDISKNPKISEMYDLFGFHSLQTQSLYSKLMMSMSHEDDSLEAYKKSLEELGFSDEISLLLESLRSGQSETLKKFIALREELDKKLENVQMWRKISNITFGATFASVLTSSVLAAGIAAPRVAASLAAAAAFPIGSAGKWVNSYLKKCEETIKAQWDVVDSLCKGTEGLIKALEGLLKALGKNRILVQGPEKTVSSNHKDAVQIVIDEMGILSEHAHSCSRDILSQDHQATAKEVPLVDGANA